MPTNNTCLHCPDAYAAINGRYCILLHRYVEYDKSPKCDKHSKQDNMRYALRNQDKIAAAYGILYLNDHLIASLDAFFVKGYDEEELYDYMIECDNGISYIETNSGNYEILRINDVADNNAMWSSHGWIQNTMSLNLPF